MSTLSDLAARMKYLRNVESIFSAALLPTLAGYWWGTATQVAWSVRIPPLVLVCYILGQGAFYWHLKLRQYGRGSVLPPWLPTVFRAFFRTNVIGLAAVSLVVGSALARGMARVDVVWGFSLWAFAALEHINYYHWQLMYDTRGALRRLKRTRRLRTSLLADDMISCNG